PGGTSSTSDSLPTPADPGGGSSAKESFELIPDTDPRRGGKVGGTWHCTKSANDGEAGQAVLFPADLASREGRPSIQLLDVDVLELTTREILNFRHPRGVIRGESRFQAGAVQGQT